MPGHELPFISRLEPLGTDNIARRVKSAAIKTARNVEQKRDVTASVREFSKKHLKDLRERAVIATSPRARGAVTKLFSHLLITNATSKDPSIPHDVRVVFTETNIDAVKVIKGKGRSVPQGGYGTKTSGFIVVETRKGEAFKAVLFLFAKTTTKVVAATSAEDMMHDSNISLSLFSGRDFLKSRKAMLSRPSKMVLSDTV